MIALPPQKPIAFDPPNHDRIQPHKLIALSTDQKTIAFSEVFTGILWQ